MVLTSTKSDTLLRMTGCVHHDDPRRFASPLMTDAFNHKVRAEVEAVINSESRHDNDLVVGDQLSEREVSAVSEAVKTSQDTAREAC